MQREEINEKRQLNPSLTKDYDLIEVLFEIKEELRRLADRIIK